MTMEPSSLPGRAESTGSAHRHAVRPLGDEYSGLRRQAAWVIERVLADPAPESSAAKELLLGHLSDYPERPEKALAEHLTALRFPGSVADNGPTEEPAVPAPESPESMAVRIAKVLQDRMLVTAFQPIYEFSAGAVIGVEALTRFVSDGGDTAEEWFTAAAAVRLGGELEFAALESALASAQHLPAGLFVALKVSPDTCLDPLLPGLLEQAMPALDRVVLELTEAMTPEQPAALVSALAPLRRRGLRLSVGRLGSYGGSIRHVRQLKPDILKLDRDLVAGIDADDRRDDFGQSLAGFARELRAVLIAEGIESRSELTAIAGLGVTAGQGYHLGRPTIRPRDWAGWSAPAWVCR